MGRSLRFHSPLIGSHIAFFGMKKYPCLNGLSDGRMNLFLRFFSMNFACSCSSACDSGNTLDLITVGASGSSSILWSHGREGGNRWASLSLNTFQKSLHHEGIRFCMDLRVSSICSFI